MQATILQLLNACADIGQGYMRVIPDVNLSLSPALLTNVLIQLPSIVLLVTLTVLNTL